MALLEELQYFTQQGKQKQAEEKRVTAELWLKAAKALAKQAALEGRSSVMYIPPKVQFEYEQSSEAIMLLVKEAFVAEGLRCSLLGHRLDLSW